MRATSEVQLEPTAADRVERVLLEQVASRPSAV
jgi:hypothetical protein